TDADGLVTTFLRDSAGHLESVTGPYGHVSEITTDDAGRVIRVLDPLGRQVGLDYADGLLAEYTDPAQGAHRFAYDDAGRLTSDEGPTGYRQELTRTLTDGGYVVTRTTPLGRSSQQTAALGAGGERLRV